MNYKWPRLSDLMGNNSRDACALCMTPHSVGRWQECDDQDLPEARVVVLCNACAEMTIAPHPRLYRKLAPNEFVPGSARVCTGCKWQVKLGCTSPLAVFNGGTEPGLSFTPKPVMAHLRLAKSVGGSRWMCWEYDPVVACSGKEVV